MKKYNNFGFKDFFFEKKFLNMALGGKPASKPEAQKTKPQEGPKKPFDQYKAEVIHKYHHFHKKAQEYSKHPKLKSVGAKLLKVTAKIRLDVLKAKDLQKKLSNDVKRVVLKRIDTALNVAIKEHKLKLPAFKAVKPSSKPKSSVEKGKEAPSEKARLDLIHKLDHYEASIRKLITNPNRRMRRWLRGGVSRPIRIRRGEQINIHLKKDSQGVNMYDYWRKKLSDVAKSNSSEKNTQIGKVKGDFNSYIAIYRRLKIDVKIPKVPSRKVVPVKPAAPKPTVATKPSTSREAVNEKLVAPSEKAIFDRIDTFEKSLKSLATIYKTPESKKSLARRRIALNKIKQDAEKAKKDKSIKTEKVRLTLGQKLDTYDVETSGNGKPALTPLVKKIKAAPKKKPTSTVVLQDLPPKSRRNEKIPSADKPLNNFARALESFQLKGLSKFRERRGSLDRFASSLTFSRRGSMNVAPIPGGYTAVKLNLPRGDKAKANTMISMVIYDSKGGLVTYRIGESHDWRPAYSNPSAYQKNAEFHLGKAFLEDAASRIIEHPKGNIKFKSPMDKVDFMKALKKLSKFSSRADKFKTWAFTVGNLHLNYVRGSGDQGKFIIKLKKNGRHLSFDTSGSDLLLGDLRQDRTFDSSRAKPIGSMKKEENLSFEKTVTDQRKQKADSLKKKEAVKSFTNTQSAFKKTLNPKFKGKLKYTKYKEGAKTDPQEFTVPTQLKNNREHKVLMRQNLRTLLNLSQYKGKNKVVMITLSGGIRKGKKLGTRKAMLYPGVPGKPDPKIIKNGKLTSKRATFHKGDKISVRVVNVSSTHTAMLNKSMQGRLKSSIDARERAANSKAYTGYQKSLIAYRRKFGTSNKGIAAMVAHFNEFGNPNKIKNDLPNLQRFIKDPKLQGKIFKTPSKINNRRKNILGLTKISQRTKFMTVMSKIFALALKSKNNE